MTGQPTFPDRDVLENVRLAAGCGAGSSMLLAVAAASLGDVSLRDGIATLTRLAGDMERLETATPRPHRELAVLAPDLALEPEVARMRPDVDDHEVRGRLLFGELLGERSFFQVAALAIAGLELDRAEGDMLGELGVVTQLADPRIWPLTVARRVAGRTGGLGASVVAGLATLCTEQMTALPVGAFIRFLDRVEKRVDGGASVEAVVREIVAGGERIPGVGRPVLRGDERVPWKLAVAKRFGREHGRSLELARRIDDVIHELKGLRVNSAGFQGALLRDLGFDADSGAAVCLLYFLVPLLTHAVAGQKRRAASSASSASSASDATSGATGLAM